MKISLTRVVLPEPPIPQIPITPKSSPPMTISFTFLFLTSMSDENYRAASGAEDLEGDDQFEAKKGRIWVEKWEKNVQRRC